MSAAPKAGFSAAGLTGGLRGKKPLHDPTSQRKSSVPVVTPIVSFELFYLCIRLVLTIIYTTGTAARRLGPGKGVSHGSRGARTADS